jgi:hypothetical protein
MMMMTPRSLDEVRDDAMSIQSLKRDGGSKAAQ